MVFRTTWILPGKVGKASQTRWHLNWDLRDPVKEVRKLKAVQDVWSGVGVCADSGEAEEAGTGEEGAALWDSGGKNSPALPSLCSSGLRSSCQASVLLRSDFGLFFPGF